jgi:DNA-binding FadR family transcriptional regulator
MSPPETHATTLSSARRVRKAYEQVADQLRDMIMGGELMPGQRLPNEAGLAVQFGVSRATVREALRVLSAQNLVRTAKGAGGGSFVTHPSADHISEFLSANIGLLSRSQAVDLDDFLEVRELLEVPAARLTARRHDAEDLERLRRAIPDEPLRLGTEEQFVFNRDFHSALVVASGNTLLAIAAQPIFSVLQTHLKRSHLGEDFHTRINHDHRAILAALETGDEEAAAAEMERHLVYLRPKYEQVWRSGGGSDDDG